MPAPVDVRFVTEHEFRAMGTDVHVLVVDGADDLLRGAEAHVRQDEERWSRFLDSSELGRVNRAAGAPVTVSPATVDLVDAALSWWRRTGGVFDPTLGESLAAAGYDRTFSAIRREAAGAPVLPASPSRAGALRVDRRASTVAAPSDGGLDLGGIAKGWCADRCVAELLAGGAAGACVNIGGDLRVGGVAPAEAGWSVAVETPTGDGALGVLLLADHGVATSTTARRRWRGPQGDARHHVVDPATGRPARTELVAATIVAATAEAAEVLATTALVDRAVFDGLAGEEAAGGWGVAADGRLVALGDAPPLHPLPAPAGASR